MSDSGAGEDVGCRVVKEGRVHSAGKQMLLRLTSNGFTLNVEESDGQKKTKGLDLLWCDVIIAQPGKDANKDSFCIHYMLLKSNKKLQIKSVDISSTEESPDVWISTIKQQCFSVNGRPRKVFVVVNPMGGSASGQQVYEKKVHKIFELAEIQADVHVSERAGHVVELVENQDFSSYDGIVAVGGDGTYQEVIHGLTIQVQKSAGVDYNDQSAKLKSLSTPIGVIPAGTGNGVSGWFNGVIDVDTAALRVIRGEQHQATAMSVHADGKLLNICGLLLGNGYFSDLILRTDELRWMKRMRYPYALLASIFRKKRIWHGKLEYRQAPDSSEEGNERGASSAATEKSTENPGDSSWIKYDGKTPTFNSVCVFIANIIYKDNVAYTDVYSDHVSVVVDHGCPTTRLLKFFMKFAQGKRVDPIPPDIEILRNVQGLRLKITRDADETDENVSVARAKERQMEHYVNLDGEAKRMDVPELEMNVIPSFVLVFGVKPADIGSTANVSVLDRL